MKVVRFFVVTVLLGISICGYASKDLEYEQRLLDVLHNVQKARLDTALADIRGFLEDYPKSRVGYLIYGDILTAMAQPVEQFGGAYMKTHAGIINDLKSEVRLRWQHNQLDTPAHLGLQPRNLLELGPHPYALVADLNEARIYIYANNGAGVTLVNDYFLTQGLKGAGKAYEGDRRTPVGVYKVTGHIPDAKLPDLYGIGAFPLDYPNIFDRNLGRTGSGIWLHGTPSYTYNRAPQASDGCLVVSNPDLDSMQSFIQSSSSMPVVIANGVHWETTESLTRYRKKLMDTIEQWRMDWESLNIDLYLRHYSRAGFKSHGKNFNDWAKHKRLVNGSKAFIRVTLEDMDMFRYPGEAEIVVVSFNQNYQSDNYRGRVRKQQYWEMDSTGNWRIVFEG